MSSNIHVHRPYVLKALSKPLGHADGPGAHTVGDVFGQKQNSKRRRRPELSVAIDGEAVHIYDVSAFQLACRLAQKLMRRRSSPPKP